MLDVKNTIKSQLNFLIFTVIGVGMCKIASFKNASFRMEKWQAPVYQRRIPPNLSDRRDLPLLG